jgi:hypothetical protein
MFPLLPTQSGKVQGMCGQTRLRAAIEDVQERATAGEALPQSFGIPRAEARLPRSLEGDQQELRSRRGNRDALARRQEPPAF